ncbi:uncharacterized protein [Paramisgurnus dabryanus]|uniref:uncharacterized protein n=1 Tax=Paramisgurnus dabryanus TaxID=90735 RepID=UPI003CCF26FF
MDRGEREEMMVVIYESSDAVRNDEVMINIERQQALQHTGRVSVKNRRHRSVQVCLCLLSVLLFTAVIVICVYFTNETNRLLTHNYNLTKENERLLTKHSDLQNQSRILTEEREKFRNKSDELQTALQEKNQLILQLMNEREDLKRWLIKHDRHSDNFKWIYYNFRFYYISSDYKSWSDSKGDCKERGANLVIINNKEEQEFLQMAIAGQYYYWIGLSKEGGVWKWVDDTMLTIRSWMNEYPRSYKYSCAVTSSSGFAYKSCDLKYKWICEKRILQ